MVRQLKSGCGFLTMVSTNRSFMLCLNSRSRLEKGVSVPVSVAAAVVSQDPSPLALKQPPAYLCPQFFPELPMTHPHLHLTCGLLPRVLWLFTLVVLQHMATTQPLLHDTASELMMAKQGIHHHKHPVGRGWVSI